MRTLTVSATLLFTTAALWGQASPGAKPATLSWGPAPAVFPAGAQMAVVSGDPGKEVPFVVRLRMPAGYRIQPHSHPTDETVEVIEGTFLYGMGDHFDLSKTKTMKVGDKGTLPANMHHFATAKGPTVVSVSAMGPFAMTYVNPADDPQNQVARP
jgi:quercetin dioxygenase-like cupin family protein